MSNLLLFVIMIAVAYTSPGYAATCAVGHYMNDGTCTPCGSTKFYCPGDDGRYACPTHTERIDGNAIAAENFNSKIISLDVYPGGGEPLTRINDCMAYLQLSNDRGKMSFMYKYNVNTDKYDSIYHKYWWAASPGYYLNRLYGCWADANYYENLECPAGGYCPGVGASPCPTGQRPETKGLEICGDNTYSTGSAASCTACPAKTGNNINTLAGHAGASSCISLCSAGGTKLNAGGYSFNLWAGGKCTSPAINVGLSGGTCCVNLEPGAANGAINVQYNGNTYHTVN